MKAALVVVIAALALCACADYGYVYSYDPYLGPRGHYVGPFEHPAAGPALACARIVYSGPYYGGYRGPYDSGPYCAAVEQIGRSPPEAETALVR